MIGGPPKMGVHPAGVQEPPPRQGGVARIQSTRPAGTNSPDSASLRITGSLQTGATAEMCWVGRAQADQVRLVSRILRTGRMESEPL
jgi:hypothetical protein